VKIRILGKELGGVPKSAFLLTCVGEGGKLGFNPPTNDVDVGETPV
jgi:hypothetical protein